MSQLKTNLEEIFRQKETLIIPRNIKKGITILGVSGDYQGEFVPFESIEERDAAAESLAIGTKSITYNANTEEILGIDVLTANGWETIANQFTLNSPNELLPGISAFGAEGVITGNDSVYDKVEINKLVKHRTENDNYFTYFIPSNSNFEGKSIDYHGKENVTDYQNFLLKEKARISIESIPDKCLSNVCDGYTITILTNEENSTIDIKIFDENGTEIFEETKSNISMVRNDVLISQYKGNIKAMFAVKEEGSDTFDIYFGEGVVTNGEWTGTFSKISESSVSYSPNYSNSMESDVEGHIMWLKSATQSESGDAEKPYEYTFEFCQDADTTNPYTFTFTTSEEYNNEELYPSQVVFVKDSAFLILNAEERKIFIHILVLQERPFCFIQDNVRP